jgi:hypothetical protein
MTFISTCKENRIEEVHSKETIITRIKFLGLHSKCLECSD